jgi:hypothetical protein
MHAGDPLGDRGLPARGLTLRVESHPQRLDVKEMDAEPRLEDTADMALPTAFGTDEQNQHDRTRGAFT